MIAGELRDKAHGAARAKGWWEGEIRSEEEAAMLIVTEIAEASEAVRNRWPAICQFAATDPAMRTPEMAEWNHQIKPEGEATELADVLIRIADFFGWKKWDLVEAMSGWVIWDGMSPRTMSVEELADYIGSRMPAMKDKKPLSAHLLMSKWASRIALEPGTLHNHQDPKKALGHVAALVLGYCGAKGLPIEKAIEVKMKFNETRPHRHGGKAL